MTTHSIMIQGTGSDAGKTTVVAGICRILYRRGVKVAPFKPQNMALNSAVTPQGREIGRAQAMQAQAAGVEPHSDMNPVLIKPCSDTGAQIIINGLPHGNMDARQYHQFKPQVLNTVLQAFENLKQQNQYVLIEGAGSPAEVNLRDRDIANMGFAEAADCPVVLVADIDKGGVFAQFIGTLECLSHSERNRITGFIINRFRGDVALLTPGIDWLEQQTGKPVFGVIPYLDGINLSSEDAIDTGQTMSTELDKLNIVIPVFPRISNSTDFDPLRLHPEVNLQFVGPGRNKPPADLVILPGTKAVRDDLQWLRSQGWDHYLQRHARYGGKILGICGGYQMLGNVIRDPYGVEGKPGETQGLGWLPLDTELGETKILRRVTGKLCFDKAEVSGYEIHMGTTHASTKLGTFIHFPERNRFDDDYPDSNQDAAGSLSDDGLIAGTYLHGLFDAEQACRSILRWAGLNTSARIDLTQLQESAINNIADAIERHVDVNLMFERCKTYHSSESSLQLQV